MFPDFPGELGGQELTSLNTALSGSLPTDGGETHQLSSGLSGAEWEQHWLLESPGIQMFVLCQGQLVTLVLLPFQPHPVGI